MSHVKDSSYFSHDFNARHDFKVRAMIASSGIDYYGIYWVVNEILAEERGHRLPLSEMVYAAVASECSCSVDKAKDAITAMISTFALYETDANFFWSESLLRRLKMREERSRKLSEAGRKGGIKSTRSKRGLSKSKPGLSQAQAVKESKVKESNITKDPSNSKILTNSTNTADAVCIRKGMVYFRCSDNQYQAASEWYRKKGLNTKLIPIAAEQIDIWLQSDTPNAKKARASESHYRRLYSAGFLDEAQRLFKIQQGGASRTRFDAAMNEIDSAFTNQNIIDAEVA